MKTIDHQSLLPLVNKEKSDAWLIVLNLGKGSVYWVQAPSYILAHPTLHLLIIFELFFNLTKVSVEIDWAQFYIKNFI